MNQTDQNDDVFDRRLDWALGEIEDRRTPPDLTATILARIDDAPPVRAAGRVRWLAAAVALLGLGAVVAVALGERAADRRAAQDPLGGDPVRDRLQDMGYVVVRSRAELDALPQGTLGVELVDLGYREVQALRQRCPYVRKLLLRGPEIEGGAVTSALGLPNLRHLDLADCPNVSAVAIDWIVRAPALLQLRLGGQPWLEYQHLRRLAEVGIEPMLADPGHPLTLPLAALICDHGASMRARQLADREPIPFLAVRSAEEIAALHPDTTAVDGLNLTDDAVAALGRLRALKYLKLRSGVQSELFPVLDLDAPYPHRVTAANHTSVTDDGLAALSGLGELETLELAGTIEVTGPGLAHLARLPKLRELALICIDTSDEGLAVLPDFPALRRLRLEANHGFAAGGMQAIGRCRRLEALRLEACPQVHADDYRYLRELTMLRELRISRPQHVAGSWRDDWRPLPGALTESGVTDRVVEQFLVPIRGLEVLELSRVAAGAALAKLADLPNLRELTLIDVDGVTPQIVGSFPVGLRRLDLALCQGLDDSIGSVVRRRFPSLEVLQLTGVEALTDLAAIAEIKTLRELDVGFCRGLGAAAGEALKRCDFLQRLDCAFCPGLPNDVVPYLRERGVAVRQQKW
ncbi:MAG: hypothetical protein KDE27_04725 [Planctomycetes bacterium]|nr:hypothetical protein [Planctomycetota bacterium]